MAKDEVKVRVVLDTKGAKREMPQRSSRGPASRAKVRRRLSDSRCSEDSVLRDRRRRVLVWVQGLRRFGAASRSGFGSLIGESLGGFGAQLNELFFSGAFRRRRSCSEDSARGN